MCRPMLVLVCLAVGVAGCGPTRYDESTRPAKSESEGERKPAPPAEPLVTHVPEEGESTTSLAEPPRPESTRDHSSPGGEPASGGNSLPVELSVGVALPLTLPEGTVMSFSVDYEFVDGAPPRQESFWVVTNGQGEAFRQPCQLSAQGNLSGFIPQWRESDGPFRSRIEDAQQRPLSNWIEMR